MDVKQKPYRSPESLSEKEKWDSLNLPQKLQYIRDYYKLPIIITCIILYIISYTVYRHVTHKDSFLYTALINVTIGESLEEQLTNGFLSDQNIDTSKNQLTLYSGWYLTDDESSEYHEYTYATRMKVLAAIDGEQLDVVLMNQEAFDAFSQKGYLYDLGELLMALDPELYDILQPHLVKNTEIIEDNAQDIVLDPSLSYISETAEYPMGVNLLSADMIKNAGFQDALYFGILKNTPRLNTSISYLRYLFS